MTRLLRTLLAVVLISALAACSDDDKDPDADPSKTPTSPSASAAPVTPITTTQAGKIKGEMPRERVLEILGEPMLTQEPFGQFAGGCIYYAMENNLVSNAWQFCFNNKGVNVVLTAYSPNQPAPPEDASQVRAALLARGDSICQSNYGYLNAITTDVANALDDYSKNRNEETTATVVRQIGRFIDNLKDTHEALAAFNAPDDKLETLTTYLDALNNQIDALTQAKQAIADGDLDAYDDHGVEFTDIGKEAKTAAQDYGFTTCSAATWG